MCSARISRRWWSQSELARFICILPWDTHWWTLKVPFAQRYSVSRRRRWTFKRSGEIRLWENKIRIRKARETFSFALIFIISNASANNEMSFCIIQAHHENRTARKNGRIKSVLKTTRLKRNPGKSSQFSYQRKICSRDFARIFSLSKNFPLPRDHRLWILNCSTKSFLFGMWNVFL